jgi:2-polyprenyl-3-methyl-5-hydroxy-6-metoxy-1,4-benzoquinol methylase
MKSSNVLEQWVLKWHRLGFTDMYHERFREQQTLGLIYLLLFGTTELGRYAGGLLLGRLLRKQLYSSILDAGCGDCTYTLYLAKRFPRSQIKGVDVGTPGLHTATPRLELGRKISGHLGLSNASFEQASLVEYVNREAFDLIICFDVLHYIPEGSLALRNLFASLKPRGRLLLRVPSKQQKRILNPKFTERYDRWADAEQVGRCYEMETLISDLKTIGFLVEDAYHDMAFWGRLSFELREALDYFHVPRIATLLCVPLLKGLRHLDAAKKHKHGDGLVVLCARPT